MQRSSLLRQPLGTVESWYHQGFVDQQDFEYYVYVWRNSAFRYSHLYKQFELPYPVLRAVLAQRAARQSINP